MEQLSRARIYNLSQTVIPSLRGISKACDLGEWQSANEHKPKGSLVPRDDRNEKAFAKESACDIVEREHYSILRCLSKLDTSSDMQLYYFIQNNNA